MNPSRLLRNSVIVTLGLMVAGLSAPLGARELDLGLERTPAVERLAFDPTLGEATEGGIVAKGAAAAAHRETGLGDLRTALDWRTVGAAGLASAARQDPDADQGDGRTWRWLKRHWWVPVLVAGAIVLAVQDDTPDSDDP